MILQIEPWIDERELEQLKRVIASTFVVEHELTAEFEQLTRDLTGAKHAIAVTNGTMALYCCLKALDIGPGDEVIVPNITFIATANAVILAGATPIFCEVRADTFCMDPVKAEALITPRTKAIMPVHLYGQSADMVALSALSSATNVPLVEDAAQGVGVRFEGKHVGTFGRLGILSYYGNKTITCGEGGIVLTDDDELARKVYRLKNHGRDAKGMFIHDHIGFNFSFTEMQAAIGIAQMHKLPAIVERKRAIYERYKHALGDIRGFTPVSIDARSTPVFWFTSYLCESADALGAYMREGGVQTRRFFYPLHQQPCYKHLPIRRGDFSLSEEIYSKGISLPSSYHLTEADQQKVIDLILKFHR